MNLLKTAKHIYNIIFYSTPNMLVFFVTAKCNAKCKICFYKTSLKDLRNELSLDEISKISRSMGPIYWLLLSGGEPFLRNDLSELCSIFIKNNDVKYLQIPTNAWNANKITKITSDILENNPNLQNFVVNVSIDNLGSKHDKARGVPGLYNNLCKTIKSLNKLKKRFPNFGVAANITYSNYNYKDIFHIYNVLKNDLKLDNISLTLLRGIPRDKKALNFNPDNFFNLFDKLQKDNNQYKYYSFCKKILAKGKDFYKRKIIYNAFIKHKYTLPCKAGKNVGVLCETGNVYACELRDDNLGNIRDFNYDFKKLWNSKQIKKSRKNINKSKCYCTYECPIGPNILFNIKFLIKSIFKGMAS